jgi:hypothetical protein
MKIGTLIFHFWSPLSLSFCALGKAENAFLLTITFKESTKISHINFRIGKEMRELQYNP